MEGFSSRNLAISGMKYFGLVYNASARLLFSVIATVSCGIEGEVLASRRVEFPVAITAIASGRGVYVLGILVFHCYVPLEEPGRVFIWSL